MLDPDQRRRRAAKLFNERLKLAASWFNTLGVATFIAVAVAPYMGGTAGDQLSSFAIGLVFVIVLHSLGQVVLSFWKSEE